MSTFRILQISPRVPYPPDDGGSIGIFGITKHLALRGHEITLLSITPGQNADLSRIREYCRVKSVVVNTSNSYLKAFLNLFSQVPYTISKYHKDSVLNILKELLQREQFDIVHVDHLHMAYYGKFVKEKFGIPIILREHNVESILWQRYHSKIANPLLKVYARIQCNKLYKYESEIVAHFDRCLAITEEDRKRLEGINPRAKVSVIPAGVDSCYFCPIDVPIEPYSIVSVASMDWPPNIEGMLWFTAKIWPIVKKRVPQAKFYIVGKNPSVKIRRLAAKDIIVTGFVEDVREFMAKAAVFIVPLRIGGGMRIRILNAMAMGKAVVSTSVGCEGIDVEDGKNIYVADSEEKFAQRIIELLEDGAKREKLGKMARKVVVEKYQWEQIAEQLENEYREVLKGRK